LILPSNGAAGPKSLQNWKQALRLRLQLPEYPDLNEVQVLAPCDPEYLDLNKVEVLAPCDP
jgi:hypothetical protein